MPQQPLYLRLYFQPPLSDLARLIGYRGLPAPEAKEKMKALEKQHGREAMEAAATEIVHIDPSTEPPTVRLTDEARKFCWQLLGPPPEVKAEPSETPAPVEETKRKRKRKATAKPAAPEAEATATDSRTDAPDQ